MSVLIRVSQFLYFLLFMIFIVFIVVYQKSLDINVHFHIVLLFSFLLLPLFDILMNIFIKDKNIFDSRLFFAAAIIVFCFV